VPEAYGTLAEVYDFLVPDSLLTPEGSAAAFDGLVALDPGARVLDCAAGSGTLAVGLALRGFGVVATDASEAMVRRTRALAAARTVELPAHACAWEQLPARGWKGMTTSPPTPSGWRSGRSATRSWTTICAPPASSPHRARTHRTSSATWSPHAAPDGHTSCPAGRRP